jgi:glucose-6-phosphate 1-epimerase
VTLQSPDGATLTVSPYGGQVLGWAPQPGQERFYLSPLMRCGNGQSIRGGIPVIFPQFSGRGPLPKHGFARDRVWHAQEIPDPPGAAWRARLEQDDDTLAIWPFPFVLQISARATAHDLEVTLQVLNPGSQPWSFAAALHNYLLVGNEQASISGLGGHELEQNANPGEIIRPGDDQGAWMALEQRDVRVLDVSTSVTLIDPGRPPMVISGDGFTDRVVWNPGPNPGIGDVPDGDERSFVCIEPAVVTPVELAEGASWTGRQLFSV